MCGLEVLQDARGDCTILESWWLAAQLEDRFVNLDNLLRFHDLADADPCSDVRPGDVTSWALDHEATSHGVALSRVLGLLHHWFLDVLHRALRLVVVLEGLLEHHGLSIGIDRFHVADVLVDSEHFSVGSGPIILG